MKKIVLGLSLVFATLSVSAQASSQDPNLHFVTSYQRFGDTTIGSDGKVYQHVNRDTTIGSDGTVYHRYGNVTIGTDGSVNTRIGGNLSIGSDGRLCQDIGAVTLCN